MVVCLFIFRVFGIIVIEVKKGEKELKQRKKVVNKRDRIKRQRYQKGS